VRAQFKIRTQLRQGEIDFFVHEYALF